MNSLHDIWPFLPLRSDFAVTRLSTFPGSPVASHSTPRHSTPRHAVAVVSTPHIWVSQRRRRGRVAVDERHQDTIFVPALRPVNRQDQPHGTALGKLACLLTHHMSVTALHYREGPEGVFSGCKPKKKGEKGDSAPSPDPMPFFLPSGGTCDIEDFSRTGKKPGIVPLGTEKGHL